jgi:hypothetical protein
MGHGANVGTRRHPGLSGFLDSVLTRNLIWVLVLRVVMMMVVVVMMMSVTILRLRRKGYREAEDENCSEQKLFHSLTARG